MTNATDMRNRLINEQSPYLLQHAHNPVDWWPWCDEAFAKAKAEDMPVFLSVGYSTCHWCHVMAHESFEDRQVARLLNARFVPIKLDREERPDIDAVYMAACQAMTGSGGWPLTVLLTPDGAPFFAGTYFPKAQLLGLLERVDMLWRTDRDALADAGARLTEALRGRAQRDGRAPDPELLRRGFRELADSFSERDGGFGGAPRFPMPHNLLFLMAYARRSGEDRALQMAQKQLDQMYRGGLFDHVGGGFARYSTDRRWLVPHFEKMLYDNALLLYAYAEAYVRTGREVYALVARRTADYVLSEMTHEEGGFFSAQDADSGGSEGGYYLFGRGEAAEVAGEALCDWYGVTERGNFEGGNILNLLDNPDWEREPAGMEADRSKLYEYRKGRMALGLDDKVLCAWNGLMIAGLAHAGQALGDGRMLDAAMRAHGFLKARLTRPDGRLFVRWRSGDAAGEGLLDDYACYAWGLIELYRAVPDDALLAQAEALTDQMVLQFWDEARGGFFMNGERAGLIDRPKEHYDGASPSGNSVAALVLTELSGYTAKARWSELADRQMRYLAGQAQLSPSACCFGLYAMGRYLEPSKELLCVCADEDARREAEASLEALDEPRLYALIKSPNSADALARLAPFARDYPIPEHGTLYYLCENGACKAPVDNPEALALRRVRRNPSRT